MSEENTEASVEDHINEMAKARSPEAPAEDAGKSAKPETGEDTADPETPEGKDAESEEVDDDAEGEEQEASGEDDDSEDEEEKPKRKPTRAQKRIRKLVRERDQVAERLKERETELRVLLQQIDRQGQRPNGDAQPQDQDPEPNQDNYTDYAKYLKDVAAWSGRQEAKKSLQAERQAIQKAQAANKQQQAEAAQVEGATSLFEKGGEEFEDFEEVASTNMPVSQVMTDTILEMDDGHKVLYHLGNNPEEAERIAGLPSVSQVRELTKLEVKLTSPAKPAPKPKKTTSATEPIKPVKGGGGPRKTDPDELSIKEYMQDYQRRRRSGEIQV